MKLFTLLFSIYILLLSAVPCCAYDRCGDRDEITQGDHKQTNSPAQEKGCSNCSPFFSCHSCCGFIVQERISVAQAAVVYPHKVFGLYRLASYSVYLLPLSEPPRW